MLRASGEPDVTLKTGQIAPDFEQDTGNGSLRFHTWIQGSWCLLFSCPSDQVAKSNPLALASLAEAALRRAQWSRRKVKLIGLGTRSSDGQARWQEEVARTHGVTLNFPVIADADRMVAKLYRIADAEIAELVQEKCHAFLIDPSRKVRLVRTYPAALGCDFISLQVAIDELQRADARPSCSYGHSGDSPSRAGGLAEENASIYA